MKFNHQRMFVLGEEVGPKEKKLLNEQPRFMEALGIFYILKGAGDETVLDLGCLEGGFAYLFAQNGFFAEGVEVRDEAFERCKYLKKVYPDLPLDYYQSDVWDFLGGCEEDHTEFTFLAGLLYHIENPFQFMKEVSRVTSKAVFIDTHFAPEQDTPKELQRFQFSEPVEHEGYKGRFMQEYPKGKKYDHQKFPLSSFGNEKSFWAFRSNIPRMIIDAGFNYVLPLHHPSPSNRASYIGIKLT